MNAKDIEGAQRFIRSFLDESGRHNSNLDFAENPLAPRYHAGTRHVAPEIAREVAPIRLDQVKDKPEQCAIGDLCRDFEGVPREMLFVRIPIFEPMMPSMYFHGQAEPMRMPDIKTMTFERVRVTTNGGDYIGLFFWKRLE